MVQLDQVVVDKIKGLKLEYKEESQPELLIRIPNPNPEVRYEVEHISQEFTSLCPLHSSQPDYATITIKLTPGKWLVELKSLKFYLVSFRMVQIFHEKVPGDILVALSELLKPKHLEVIGQFSTRGGLYTTVAAEYNELRIYGEK